MKGAIKLENRKRENLAEKASDFLDLPGSLVTSLPRIEISGGRQLLIEQHKGIIEYSPSEISVNAVNGIIWIRGEGLELRAMTEKQLLISGLLRGIEFEL